MNSLRYLLALALLVAGVATAAETAAQNEYKQDDPFIISSEAFQRAHPDVRWRNLGATKYDQKRYKEAADHFRDAASYADKPSQAMLALMLWNGDGIAADRVQAYAWMDVAAERGYKTFIATRQKFWNGLSENERPRALELSKELYAEYGDERAKKRLNLEMTRQKIKVIGSHLGRAQGSLVRLPGPDGRFRSISSTQFYSPRYWNPSLYWSWQDQIWEQPQGQVEVGPVQSTDETPKDKH